MNNLKSFLHLVVNFALNGAIFTLVPSEYKVYAILGFNLLQVYLAYIDPTYALKKLGMSRQEYLAGLRKNG